MKTIELPEDRANIQVLVSHEPGRTIISKELEDAIGPTVFSREGGNRVIDNAVLAGWIIARIKAGDDITHPDTFEVTVIVPPDKEETNEN